MLSHLTVRNLAIVEAVSADFGPGLNIITGETGAGKSVLMGALHLVLGGRSDKSAIRDSASEASVEAAFTLEDTAAVDAVLADAGLPPCEDRQLLVRRTVNQSGAGRCWINDTPSTVQLLRRLGTLLVDIHGPYDNQTLLQEDCQRRLLDSYGGCAAKLEKYRSVWETLRGLQERLTALQGDSADVAAEIDRLQFAVDEISEANLTDADGEDLVERHAQAANAEEILGLGGEILRSLMDDGGSVFDRLVTVQNQLAELARIMPAAGEWRSEAQSAAVQVQELAGAINERLSQLEVEPDALAELDARLSLVQRLKRKYGAGIPEILARLERDRSRLADLSSRTEQIDKLQREIESAHQELLECGADLTKLRIKEAARLSRAITAELRDLGFLKSGFDIAVNPAPPSEHGCDAVQFGFAPNPGEPMRPLKSIASSGEIARISLAVKAVLSTHDSIPVLVFDEIDANIGGEVGSVVGQKMRRVAERHQVLSITHLPQSAVYGDTHFRVEKKVDGGRTRTGMRRLSESERVDEISRMLGGKGLTSVVETHARELLDGARRSRG